MLCCDRFGYIFSQLKYDTLFAFRKGNPKEKMFILLKYISLSLYKIFFFKVNILPETEWTDFLLADCLTYFVS